MDIALLKTGRGKGLDWMEVGGCGMVGPAVFEAVSYALGTRTGFVCGLRWGLSDRRCKQSIRDNCRLFGNATRFLR